MIIALADKKEVSDKKDVGADTSNEFSLLIREVQEIKAEVVELRHDYNARDNNDIIIEFYGLIVIPMAIIFFALYHMIAPFFKH